MPTAPPEAEVIRLARNATGISAQSAAEATKAHSRKGVSATYWRDVERGYGGRRGERVPVRASDQALAAMARVVGVAPSQLTEAGREGAATVLREIQRRESDRDQDVYDLVARTLTDPLEKMVWETTSVSQADRLRTINALREKKAELTAELAEKPPDGRRASS